MNYELTDQTNSVNNNSDINKNTFTSKYFTKQSMDESLSDFQEAKRNHSGPKTAKTNTKKAQKILKRPKGQKDIRTALKPKKNNLINYTEKFDSICKKSGIDVDTDELQIAIALSKSLQTSPSEEDNCQVEVSSEDTIKKIRTTLREYGFKVPEVKISANYKRKKNKKDYELISKSSIEKEQLISDKYSQILITNNYGHNICTVNSEVSDTPLFNKATNISYQDMKNQYMFYSVELVEHSTSNSCLLRDWSKIPGRPASPEVPKDIEMNFSEIDCSQEELDIVLSGPFLKSKKVIGLKWLEQLNSQKDHINNVNSNENNDTISNKDTPIIIETEKSIKEITLPEKNNSHLKIHRSCSPDIFEDEESVIEVITTKSATKDTNHDTMDLTECVNNVPFKNNTFNSKSNCSLFQTSNKNITKRKSNDFMDLTECVPSISKHIHINQDITQVPKDKTDVTEKNKDKLDLTQSSDSGDNLPEVFLGNKYDLNDTVPLNSSDYEKIVSKGFKSCHKVNCEVYDLTQVDNLESNQGNKVLCNDVIEIVENNNPNIFRTDTLTTNDKVIHIIQSLKVPVDTFIVVQNSIEVNDVDVIENHKNLNTSHLSANHISEKILDNNVSMELRINKYASEGDEVLSQTSNASVETVIIDQNNSNRKNGFNIAENCNLDITRSSNKCITNVIPDYNKRTDADFNSELEDNVDLTQSSDSSILIMDENYSSLKQSLEKSNSSDETVILPLKDNGTEIVNENNKCKTLGKKDDISIDYDELSIINGENAGDNCSTSYNYAFESNIKKGHSFSSQDSAFLLNNKSNDSDDTVILPLNNNSNEIADLQDKDSNLIKKVNTSIDYDDITIINEANQCYTRDNAIQGTHNKSNNVFLVDDNRNDSDETVILPITNDGRGQAGLFVKNINKGDNTSINYDEVCIIDDTDKIHNNADISSSTHSRKSKNKSRTNSSQSSQNNNFEIADNEFHYSLHKSKRENFNLGGISVLDNLGNNPSFRMSSSAQNILNNDSLPLVELNRVQHTPEKTRPNLNMNLVTPENEYIIKLDNVTPMPNYTTMSTPERNKELDKYGLKPFKRKRAIQLLTHIYNQTHPIIESIDDLPSPAKRFKSNPTTPSIRRQLLPSPKEALEMLEAQDIYEVTNEVPDIKEIACKPEDWVFQKREKAKIHSCRVPLHIAFYNYVSCRRNLRESILRYEPVDIDVIHKQLVAYGHRYDSKELLKFMDKKCITVKTTDSNTKK